MSAPGNLKAKILLVELAGIGDAILSMPAIRNLRYCFPDAYIGILTLAGPAELMKNSPYLNDIFVFNQGTRFLNNIYLLNKLRKLKIDRAINLYQLYTKRGARKIASLLSFIRPGEKIGRDTDNKGFFYDIKVKDTLYSQRHDVEYKLDLVKALGCEVKDNYLEMWFSGCDKEAVGEFLRKNSISDCDLLIGINPSARRPSHRWNWENFAAVADKLAQKYKARILITGDKNSQKLTNKISEKMSTQSIDTTGMFSLTQLTALIKRCQLYISNDTAPMHIANALEVPLVAVMGPGTIRTAPYQKKNCVVLKKDVACSPCYKFKCRKMSCFEGITPDLVINASESLLKRLWGR